MDSQRSSDANGISRCQAFIRLCDFSVVSCLGNGIASQYTYQSFNQAIPPVFIPNDLTRTPYFTFYDIIHKDFLPVNPADFYAGRDFQIRIEDLPMHRGRFHDPRVRRREEIFAFEINRIGGLNYVEDSQRHQGPDVAVAQPRQQRDAEHHRQRDAEHHRHRDVEHHRQSGSSRRRRH